MTAVALESEIQSVLVYRSGAEVHRVAELLDPSAQPPVVEIHGLPLSLIDSSVRATVVGGPTAADVHVTLGLAGDRPDRPPADDEELRAARHAVEDLRDRIEHVEQQRQRLESTPSVPRPEGKRGEAPPPSPTASRRALLAFRLEGIEALDEQLEQLRKELHTTEQHHTELQRRSRTNARQARPHELSKGVVVALIWPDGGTADLVQVQLEYRVPGARWAPAYSVSLDRELTRAELAVRAVVAQRTGEDWHGVQLRLSTAAAQSWVELPRLQSLRIGRRQARPPQVGWRPAPQGADELYGDFDRFGRVTMTSPAAGRLEDVVDEFEIAEPEIEEAFDDVVMDAMPVEEFAANRYEAESAKERVSRPRKAKKRDARRHAPAPPPPEAPMPSAAPAPQAMMAKSATLGMFGAGAVAGGVEAAAYEPPPPEPPADLAAAEDQLAYGDLRMPGPLQSGRGRLVRIRRRERYMELIRVHEVELTFDLLEVLDGAAHRAGSVAGSPLPPGCVAPRAWDGFEAVYRADDDARIDSDGEFHSVPLSTVSAEASSRHVVVPRESTDVFRQVRLVNPLDAPLLPGPVDVQVGGAYLLTADIPVTPPRGELHLGLGVDQAVKVARNTTYDEQSAGLIKGSLKLHHEILVEIANRRATPIQLEVRERIPHIRDGEDDIEIDLGEVEPPWEAWEPDDQSLKGGHRWRLEIAGGAERALKASYTVQIAAKNELSGGNRREV